MDKSKKLLPRRQKAFIGTISATQIHLRNPFVVAWWSAAYPGFGHILLSRHLRGFSLFIWEFIVNYNANINRAILYSFTGRFEMAKEVLNTKWLLLYIPTYIFAIWDSYRATVDLNQDYLLAAREDAAITPFKMTSFTINYLDKRKPWVATAWSFLAPGTGQLYDLRLFPALFGLAWWMVNVYFSNLLPAVHYSLLGQFSQAKSVIEPHFFLNIPSILLFATYDAYVTTVERNKLFDWEQSKFLNKNYQDQNFAIPVNKEVIKGDNMYIFSTFEHSKHLELAITAIEVKGIAKDKILAVPMDKRGEERKLFDTLHSSDGLSLFDLPAILGTIFMLFGSIYGFVLKWGPIWWGLIGLATGALLGLIIKLIITNKYSER